MIYLDNSATTRPYDEVIALMVNMQQDNFGNPSSLHHAGVLAERATAKAREQVLSALGAQDGNFVFTAGGTEANNLAILGSQLHRVRRTPRIITSQIEHPSVSETVHHLKSLGADCQFVRVDSSGHVDVEHFESILNDETTLVSVMTVNNETGSIQDIAALSKLTKQKNPDALFHTDAVQAFGKIPIRVQNASIDLLSVSGHKINGPKGTGGLYIRPRVHIKPILYGGGQEGGLRSGTQNSPAIAGFGLAAEITCTHLEQKAENMSRLRDLLIQGLSNVPGCTVVTQGNTAPHVVCAVFPGLKSETLLHTLEARNIYVSSGSACSSNKPQLSPTLLAMGRSRKEIEGAIRFSLGHDTTEADIVQTLEAVQEDARLLLGISGIR